MNEIFTTADSILEHLATSGIAVAALCGACAAWSAAILCRGE
jgi:hypothetical protein